MDATATIPDAVDSTTGSGCDEQYTGPPALKKQKLLSKDEVSSLRKEYISPSLSLHYSSVNPLKIVYGKGAYLYDENDQPYLDCINNVTQVGHCHPHVVEAFSSQNAKLGYAQLPNSDLLDSYTRRLLSHFPAEHFGHVFFTNSGTEANDLALHIAEVVTGHSEVIAVEGAYHGHSKHLIGLSTYKLQQQKKGGQYKTKGNPNAWVAPLPDAFRGMHRGDGAGENYASEVQKIITKAKAQEKQIASFISEPFLGCAGQVKLPDGYLKSVFEIVHAAGGLCIVDEIQTGFGRAGDYFWLHESQDVVPDMVTVGKPMGNGHPVSGVITTKEIAKKFEDVVGQDVVQQLCSDPVSLAVADAVLETIEVEKMQANAKHLGEYVMTSVRAMMDKHPCIGDVRGYGLFIGVEIVNDSDKESRTPDKKLCLDIVHKVLLDHHIMIKEDGLEYNVIKIKPPLCFTRQNADKLLAALENTLTDLGK